MLDLNSSNAQTGGAEINSFFLFISLFPISWKWLFLCELSSYPFNSVEID